MSPRGLLGLCLALAGAGALALLWMRSDSGAPPVAPAAQARGPLRPAPPALLREPAAGREDARAAPGGSAQLAEDAREPPAVLSGRVLDGDGAPLPGARLAYRLARLASPPPKEARAGADGRFAIGLRAGELGAGQLVARAPEGAGERAQVVDVPRGGLDVGDLVVERVRDLHFVVRSTSGAPLGGAEVRTVARGIHRSARSDDQGRGVLRALPRSVELLACDAQDHWPERVALRPGFGSEAAPLELVLELVPALLVDVRFDDGASPKGLHVRVEVPALEAFVDREGNRSRLPPAGELWTGFRSADGLFPRGSLSTLGEAGRLEVPCLDPSGGAEVAILDGAFRALARGRAEPRQIAAREPLAFELPGPPKELVVRAEGPSGEPLRVFEVRVPDADEAIASALVRGRATLVALVGASVDLIVHAAGLEPTVVRGIPLPEPRNEVLVRIGAGLPLRVRARSADGQPVEVREARLELGHGLVVASKAPGQDGGHRFEGLPAHPVVAHLLARGRWRRCVHDPRDGDLELRLPPEGAILLRIEPAAFIVTLVGTDPEGLGQGRRPSVPSEVYFEPGASGNVRLRISAEKADASDRRVLDPVVDHPLRGLRVDGLEPGEHVLVLEWAPEAPQPIVQRIGPLEVRAGEVIEVRIDTRGVRWR